MGTGFAVGDIVRVTFEGKVERINKIIGDETAVELKINPIDGDYTQYVATNKVTSVEKIEPPVEVFGPGDVVRGRATGRVYTLGIEGYICHREGRWYDYQDSETFESTMFGRVSVE